MIDEGFERVASLDDLVPNAPLAVEFGNDEQVCLIRIGSDVYAISNNCTHADFPMSDGEMVDDFVIECGLHGAQFDVRDGAAVELPATDPIGCYEVRVRDDEVWIKSNGG